jgi:RecA/RadA recombinase
MDANETLRAFGPEGLRAYAEAEAQAQVSLPPTPLQAHLPKAPAMFGALRVYSIDDALTAPPRRYLLKGILGAGEMSVLYGEPSSGKTFLALHIAYAMARGRSVFGRKVVAGAVMYCSMEGSAGIDKRLSATLKEFGRADAFFYTSQPINLLADNSVVRDVIDAANSNGVKFIVFDTLARAMSGGNENASDDMSRMIGVVDEIKDKTDAHVMFVHHTGKDTSRGARGHSSLKAAADTELEIRRLEDGTYVAVLTKAKDDPDGVELPFKLRTLELDKDEDGDPITTCVIEELPFTPAGPERRGLGGKKARLAEAILNYLASNGADPSVKIPREAVRKEMQERGLLELDAAGTLKAAGKTRLYETLKAMKNSGQIDFNEMGIWTTS